VSVLLARNQFPDARKKRGNGQANAPLVCGLWRSRAASGVKKEKTPPTSEGADGVIRAFTSFRGCT
jgi:hypothetical protein